MSRLHLSKAAKVWVILVNLEAAACDHHTPSWCFFLTHSQSLLPLQSVWGGWGISPTHKQPNSNPFFFYRAVVGFSKESRITWWVSERHRGDLATWKVSHYDLLSSQVLGDSDSRLESSPIEFYRHWLTPPSPGDLGILYDCPKICTAVCIGTGSIEGSTRFFVLFNDSIYFHY